MHSQVSRAIEETTPTTSLRLGAGVEVDVTLLQNYHTLINGITGSGKSNSAVVIAEELLKAKVRLLIFDTDKGEYTPLKDFFPYIKIIKNSSQTDIIENLTDGGIPHIIDMSGWSGRAERLDYMVEVLEPLYENLKQRKEAGEPIPVVIFLEEASVLIPARHKGYGTARTSQQKINQIIEEIARRGRSRGATLIILDQRPSGLQYDPISQCRNRFLFKVTDDSDIDRYGRLLGGISKNKAAERLERLPPYHAFYKDTEVAGYRIGRFRRKRIRDIASNIQWKPAEVAEEETKNEA